ncbi:hypothetical protein QRD43_20920 [Pelomonas sp. APW6]|uniref:Uncharacterized protein n=1 Tax=Roseateles subflavus TaxID=3053353 RepID=A0ABT7LND4_9BURK|nr:hypothetical protein [Pelomonas sp. APW6]MDL5034378.1 hypothetical protein [Pelomonas sp. APW6]
MTPAQQFHLKHPLARFVEGLPDLVGRRRFQDMEFAALNLATAITAVRSRRTESTGLVSVSLHEFTQVAATAFEVAAGMEGLSLEPDANVAGHPGANALVQLEWMFATDAEKLEDGDLLPKSFMGGYEVRVLEVIRALQAGLQIDEAWRLPTDPLKLFAIEPSVLTDLGAHVPPARLRPA